MQRGQFNRPSAPWAALAWGLGLAAALGSPAASASDDSPAALAGAPQEADRSATAESVTADRSATAESVTAESQSENSAVLGATGLMLRSYDVADLLAEFKDAGMRPQAAEHALAQFPGIKFWSDGEPTTPPGTTAQVVVDGQPPRILGGDHPPAQVVGTRLYVFATAAQLAGVREGLERLRKHGFAQQVSIELRLLTVPADMMASLDVDWSIAEGVPAGVQLLSFPAKSGRATDIATAPLPRPAVATAAHQRQQVGRGILQSMIDTFRQKETPAEEVQLATFAVGTPARVPQRQESGRLRPTPILSSILDDVQLRRLLTEVQENPRANLLLRPKLTVFNGQEALISSHTERPFVTSVEPVSDGIGKATAFQPIITIASEGIAVQATPVIGEDGRSVDLACIVQHNRVRTVDLLSFKAPSGTPGTGVTLQVPDVVAQMLRSETHLPAGSTLALSGIQVDENGQPNVLLALLTCRVLDDSEL